MEVHHHSHHPKKWKEYITEFLMLFLAVTLGFLAENIREHQVVVERKNQNLEAMVLDLKKDSATLEELTTFYTIGLNNLEDMKYASLQYQKKKILKNDYLDFVIQKFDRLNIGIGFFQNNSAYKNLIATGGLSVIKSGIIKKLISEYYEEFGIKLIDNNHLIDQDLSEYIGKTSIFGVGVSQDSSNKIFKIPNKELVEDFKNNPDFQKSILNPTFRMYTHKFEFRCGYYLYVLTTCKDMNRKLLKEFEKRDY
jgi:hypothetical protein